MFTRTKTRWIAGEQGPIAVISGLLTLAMMVGLVFALALTTDPDARLSSVATSASSSHNALD